MILQYDIALATLADVAQISNLSRHAVEHGLPWRWTPARVTRCLRDPAVNIVVARLGSLVLGFAILHYADDEAHLQLLAVQVSHRRRGIAKRLLAWLETTLQVAGIGNLHLEARASNHGALAFYRAQGFLPHGVHPGYYPGGEDAVRMTKHLHLGEPA